MSPHPRKEPNKRYSIAQRIAHLEDYDKVKSTTSPVAYATRVGLNPHTFRTWIAERRKGNLYSSPDAAELITRKRDRKFIEVEKRLVDYVEAARMQPHTKSELNWSALQRKSLEWAYETCDVENAKRFKASTGWIGNVLRRHNLGDVAADLTENTKELHMESNASHSLAAATPTQERVPLLPSTPVEPDTQASDRSSVNAHVDVVSYEV